MPAKNKITKEALIDVTTKLYHSATPEELATQHGLSVKTIERVAAALRKEGAQIPKKPRVYKNTLSGIIGQVKSDHPELFAHNG